MILFFDTSALIKRYISEPGSPKVDELFSTAEDIIVSPITKIEVYSTIKRLLTTEVISTEDYEKIKSNFNHDFKQFTVLSLTRRIERKAITLIETHQLKTLDSIQLASCLSCKKSLSGFVVSDTKLKKAAEAEAISVIDPVDFDRNKENNVQD
jgi:predicted nucleic acid-binding protein